MFEKISWLYFSTRLVKDEWDKQFLLRGGTHLVLSVCVLWIVTWLLWFFNSLIRISVYVMSVRSLLLWRSVYRCTSNVSRFLISSLTPSVRYIPFAPPHWWPRIPSYTNRRNLLKCSTVPLFWRIQLLIHLTLTRSIIFLIDPSLGKCDHPPFRLFSYSCVWIRNLRGLRASTVPLGTLESGVSYSLTYG